MGGRFMKTLFKEYPKIKKIFLAFIFSFIAIFLLRLLYEVFFTKHDIVINYDYSNLSNNTYPEDAANESASSRIITKNIATDKINQKDNAGQNITIDQKYEKSANLSAKTSDFGNDNQLLRTIIKEHDAVIQTENLTGLEGQQKLTMMIGVMPDHFDIIIEDIKAIGTLQGFSVNKQDKTAEFRNLLAEQETLKKTRDSYIAMKVNGGNIQDLLLLEDKILEIEKNLQGLGVNIGTYSTENSFCTINFTLHETANEIQEISLKFVLKCAKRSFSWTVMLYFIFIFLSLITLAVIIAYLKLIYSIKKTVMINKTDHQDNSAQNSPEGEDKL